MDKSIRIIRAYEDGGNRHRAYMYLYMCVRSRRWDLVDQPGRDHGQLIILVGILSDAITRRDGLLKKKQMEILFLFISPHKSFHIMTLLNLKFVRDS